MSYLTIKDLARKLANDLRGQNLIISERHDVNLEASLVENLRYAFGGTPESLLVRPDESPAQQQMKHDLLTRETTDPVMEKQVGGDHYKDDPIQHVEYCQRNKLTWCESSALKYLVRHRKKNKVQDVDKALHYVLLLRRIEYPDAPPCAILPPS